MRIAAWILNGTAALILISSTILAAREGAMFLAYGISPALLLLFAGELAGRQAARTAKVKAVEVPRQDTPLTPALSPGEREQFAALSDADEDSDGDFGEHAKAEETDVEFPKTKLFSHLMIFAGIALMLLACAWLFEWFLLVQEHPAIAPGEVVDADVGGWWFIGLPGNVMYRCHYQVGDKTYLVFAEPSAVSQRNVEVRYHPADPAHGIVMPARFSYLAVGLVLFLGCTLAGVGWQFR